MQLEIAGETREFNRYHSQRKGPRPAPWPRKSSITDAFWKGILSYVNVLIVGLTVFDFWMFSNPISENSESPEWASGCQYQPSQWCFLGFQDSKESYFEDLETARSARRLDEKSKVSWVERVGAKIKY